MSDVKYGEVKPFNDIYTFDCLQNAMMTAARHFDLNYPILSLHKVFYYAIDGDQIKGCSLALFPVRRLADSIGLRIISEKDRRSNWRGRYGMWFNKGGIIVAAVDDYYNPLRKDAYQRMHLPHCILIYGLDIMCGSLSVIESKYRATVLYRNMTLEFEDYEKAHFQKALPGLFIIRKGREDRRIPWKDEYMRICIHYASKSIENLRIFMRHPPAIKTADINKWLANLDTICNHVKVERYIYENIFCDDNLSRIAENIHQAWYLLRAKVIKALIASRSEDISVSILVCLNTIVALENEKLEALTMGKRSAAIGKHSN